MASKLARKAALDKIKSGKRDYEHKEIEPIYDEVDDETFKSIHRDRMNRDDFVEEDSNDATGYADNGMDDWDRDSSDDEDRPAPKKVKASTSKLPKSTSTTSLKRKAKIIIPEGANPFLKPGQTGFKDEPSAIVEDDFMAGLLGDLDEKVTTTTNSSNIKPIINRSAPIKTQAVRKSYGGASDRPRNSLASSSSTYLADTSTTMASSDGMTGGAGSATEVDDFFGDMEFGGGGADEDIEMKDEDDEDDFQIRTEVAITSKPIKRGPLANGALKPTLPPPKLEPMEYEESLILPPPPPSFPSFAASSTSAKPKGADWRRATAGLVAAAPIIIHDGEEADEDAPNALPVPESLQNKKKPQIKPTPNVKAIQDDGSLAFWWFDYVEPVPGTLFLIGKVRVRGDEDSKKWVSCCVTVTGIRRKLYVLPRERAQDVDGDDLDEDGPPEFDDVEADFMDAATDRWEAKNVECTPDFVKKKYAFDIPGIPRQERDWLEATSSFPLKNKTDIPMDASGGTFSHVFGTNTTGFEMFVLDHKIMGPCWLNIQNAKVSTANVSWTKLEVMVTTSDISIFSQDDPKLPKSTPTLTIMSLSTRTVVDHTENKKQIVIASARTWVDNDLDDITPIDKQPSTATTIIRNLHGPFPKGFEGAVRSHKTISAVQTEKELLVRLLALIHAADPDVIIGIDLLEGELDVLLHRMRELKVENWSQIGRLRRQHWPARAVSSKFVGPANAEVVNGRLRCDLTGEGSKSIIDSVSYSLTEMCEHYLKIEREDIDPEDHPLYFNEHHSSLDRLLKFTLHCEVDCYFQMAIANAVQALPLTRQLTTLAGNSWNKTLGGNRAERNEYILLHRFTEKGYVCPDKLSHKEKQAKDNAIEAKKVAEAKANGVDEEDIKTELITRKKEKFKGGLVFEPKRGLWDSYVLVMDFNSLYPSIIQEYDIDFSTIDWTEWSDKDAESLEQMPDRQPCEGETQGILPQLIAYLVSRRVMVKGLIKDLLRDAKMKGSAKYRTYDITQKALKLTANSMYGCLGYEYGRFYARPLAALVTFKGREILTRTKAEAESLSLDVIYGDTDSVMINTNETDYAAAIKIGNEFKKAINEKYKKLEIDTDAVFKRMLLLNKKKYAAITQDEDGSTSKEIKGLDMKRREFSPISKAASSYVLDQILSGESTELVVEQIHDYLTDLGENIRAGKVPLDQFIILMRLGKDAKSYPDAKSKPHVQVALRLLARGQSAKSGDVIPYIFCLPETGISALSGKAANAYHPDEVKKKGSALQVDYAVYLSGQILPPLARLCEHIEGTEKARLSECLGIESKSTAVVDAPERDWRTLQSQQSDAERFKDAEPFHFRCRVCSTESAFTGLASTSTAPVTPYGLRCANSECNAEISLGSLSVQLDILCRKFITKFYEQWLVCDDQSCANRTRMMSVYGKRCLALDCRGQMHFEYSDSQLYNQLLFLDGLFDSEATLSKSASGKQDEVKLLGEANKASLTSLRSIVSIHLAKNGRRFVNMAGLFSFVSL